MGAKEKVQEILAPADIKVNGDRAWDICVHDQRFFQRALSQGSIGVGESYMDGWWDVQQLDEFFCRIHKAELHKKVHPFSVVWLGVKGKLFNRQTKSHAKKVAQAHYDLGNDLYQVMLDRRMQYTCAYWKDAKTLDEAQEAKLQLICKKLHLQPGMKILELGGGFGGLAHFLATEYDVEVVSYNISGEQVRYGRDLCKSLPVRFEEKDYREAIHEPGQFDRVVSIGMCEHIGYKNYRPFMELARTKLKDRGLFLLHTNGSKSLTSADPWIDKYIFPNGMVPSLLQLGQAMEGLWVMEDWHNFGPDYVPTLLVWWENFDNGYAKLRAQNSRYDQRFYRMWKFYLMSAAGIFQARKVQLWQVVMSKGDIKRYVPVR
jgi:cyclopropane-fatty-acyl-phospholipid synthase